MRILAIGAHPDDVEFYCGGTLARYAQAGHVVIMAYATNGDKGHFRIPPAELARTREREARAAAAVIGAEVIWMGYPDGELFYDHPTRDRFIDMLRQARADVILTHNPDAYHPDHCAVSQLVFGASFLATVPHLKTGHPACEHVPPIYYYDVDQFQIPFMPTPLYVDIEPVIEIKEKMAAAHQSQVVWLREHDGIDVLRRVRERAIELGKECGVRYAERLVPHRPTDPTALGLPVLSSRP